MLVLGIDIGARGALAPVNAETDDLLEIFDMPILRNWPGNRPNVNAPPGEGPQALLRSVVRVASLKSDCAAARLPAAFLTPVAWKRTVGIPPGKDGASRTFPWKTHEKA